MVVFALFLYNRSAGNHEGVFTCFRALLALRGNSVGRMIVK